MWGKGKNGKPRGRRGLRDIRRAFNACKRSVDLTALEWDVNVKP